MRSTDLPCGTLAFPVLWFLWFFLRHDFDNAFEVLFFISFYPFELLL